MLILKFTLQLELDIDIGIDIDIWICIEIGIGKLILELTLIFGNSYWLWSLFILSFNM